MNSAIRLEELEYGIKCAKIDGAVGAMVDSNELICFVDKDGIEVGYVDAEGQYFCKK